MYKIVAVFACLLLLYTPLLALAEPAVQSTALVDLTPLLQAIIGIASVLVTGFLIPWLKTRFSAEQLTKAQNWVQIGVYAAEKLYGASAGRANTCCCSRFPASSTTSCFITPPCTGSSSPLRTTRAAPA